MRTSSGNVGIRHFLVLSVVIVATVLLMTTVCLAQVRWAAGGVPVSTAPGIDEQSPRIAPDGSGGAVMTWQREEGAGTGIYDLYAAGVNSAGTVTWGPSPIDSNPGIQEWNPQIAPDGFGGAVMTWQREEVAGTWIYDLYAAGVDSAGTVTWGPSPIDSNPGIQEWNPQIAPDGFGGTVMTWQREEGAGTWIFDLYAAGVNSSGTVTWGPIPIDNNPGIDEATPEIAPDGSGGAVMTWVREEGAGTGIFDLYAAGVNSAGTVTWEIPIDSNPGIQDWNPQIAPDGFGGAVMTWQREEVAGTWISDIYAQKVSDYAQTWYLAEGSTFGGFETWVLIQNSGTVPANVTLVYQTDSGTVPGPTLTVDPGTRQTVEVAQTVQTYEVSTMVTADQPVIAERAMYYNNRLCAHDSIGVCAPAPVWFLAEGSTGTSEDGTFETWVLVQNPGVTPATVTLTYQTDSGTVPGPTQTIQPGSRESFEVSQTVQTFEVSTMVTADQPVIAERAMYWNPVTGVYRQAAHDSIGVTKASDTWFLAEGSTFGGFETWVLVQNPGIAPATVTLTYQTDTGAVPGPTRTIQPGSRESFEVSQTVETFEVSTLVTSDEPVIAERAMYWNTATVNRQAAHDSIGVSRPAVTWSLAEGSTGTNAEGTFETWVLVQNPGLAPATVTLTYQTDTGAVTGPTRTIQPGSRESFNVADTVETFQVSTLVTSDEPVIAERAMYWNTPSVNRQAAHDSIGFWSY